MKAESQSKDDVQEQKAKKVKIRKDLQVESGLVAESPLNNGIRAILMAVALSHISL